MMVVKDTSACLADTHAVRYVISPCTHRILVVVSSANSHLQAVDASEHCALPALLRVVLLHRGLLQLFTTGVTSEVNHAVTVADLKLTD